MIHKLEAIARQHLLIETLEQRGSDALDFHDVSVIGVRHALLAAYNAGLGATIGNTTIIKFRGEHVLVWFSNHGLQPGTGAHPIDWHFVDPNLRETVELTDAEENRIYHQIKRLP
jgi:hypothetical protein